MEDTSTSVGWNVMCCCRVNTVNGLPYKNDPAVFSWDIINEPRCSQTGAEDGSCKSAIQGFIDSMASFIKGIDQNHMVGLAPPVGAVQSVAVECVHSLVAQVPAELYC